MTESSRLFFALWPDEATRTQVADLAQRFHRDYGGRKMARESLHMTLVFLGETLNSRLPHLDAIGNGIDSPSFTVTLAQAGAWSGGIFWLAPNENLPELMRLVSSLQRELKASGISFDGKRFTPHMTLLRGAKTVSCSIMTAPISFVAEDFALVRTIPQNSSVRYEVVKRFPLLGSR